MNPLRHVLSLVCCLMGTAAFAVPCALDDPVAGMRMIVRTAAGQTFESFNAAFGSAHVGFAVVWADSIPDRPIHLCELVPPPDATEEQISVAIEAIELGLSGVLEWGESLYLGEGPEGATGSIFVDYVGTPDVFQHQYSATLLEAPSAHTRSTGSGAVVAILDTGIDATHPLFDGRIVAGGFDFVDLDEDPSEHRNELDDDGDGLIDEGWGHGTFVASLVGLAAPDAGLLPIRVLDSEGGTDNWLLAAGMFYAIDRGVEVINACVASTYKSSAIEDAMTEARDRGIVTIAAAGNCDREDPRSFPAMQSHVIGVAATTVADLRCDFSNFGPELALSAPGGTIGFPDSISEESRMVGGVPGGELGVWEGTSMAAPLVSGAAALVRSQHPEWEATSATWQSSLDALLSTSDSIDVLNPGYEGMLGAGRLNLATLAALAPPAPALGDLDADGSIGVNDLLLLIAGWGLIHSSADLDGDGVVATNDLLFILAVWN